MGGGVPRAELFGFVEMLIFIVLVLSGFFYIWKKGALDWSQGSSGGSPDDARGLHSVPNKCCLNMLKDIRWPRLWRPRYPDAITGRAC